MATRTKKPGMRGTASPMARQAFLTDGYVIVRSLFDREEIALLKRAGEEDVRQASKNVMEKGDQEGGVTRLRMWNRAGDDIFGAFSGHERIVNRMEMFLGGPVYLYSAKMILKDAREGGAWEWHQDYGYWYNYGCLLPDMASCFIAIDKATKENGCLQVLKASHHIGRIDHERLEGQTNADKERVEEAVKRFDRIYVELDPGDALFFHSNVVHRSDQNRSDHRRWAYICSYNTVANKPYKKVRDYGNYEPLKKISSGALKKMARISTAQNA